MGGRDTLAKAVKAHKITLAAHGPYSEYRVLKPNNYHKEDSDHIVSSSVPAMT
jgi:hypothetical protein